MLQTQNQSTSETPNPNLNPSLNHSQGPSRESQPNFLAVHGSAFHFPSHVRDGSSKTVTSTVPRFSLRFESPPSIRECQRACCVWFETRVWCQPGDARNRGHASPFFSFWVATREPRSRQRPRKRTRIARTSLAKIVGREASLVRSMSIC